MGSQALTPTSTTKPTGDVWSQREAAVGGVAPLMFESLEQLDAHPCGPWMKAVPKRFAYVFGKTERGDRSPWKWLFDALATNTPNGKTIRLPFGISASEPGRWILMK